MLNRYLGNKTELLSPITSVIDRYCVPHSRICDVFSGTLSVSMELKRRGFSVIANDINLFSHVIGKAFLVNSEIPEFDVNSLIPWFKHTLLRDEAIEWAENLVGMEGFEFIGNPLQKEKCLGLLSVLLYLKGANCENLPIEYQRSDFFDTYTEEGTNSAFVSQRGSTGRRRFFTAHNGRRIDVALNHVRYWRRLGFINDIAYSVLLCILMRAVEKVSNTQGTYHDFPRNTIDVRALNPLRLEVPRFDSVLTGGVHLVGTEEDSLEFVRHAPKHELIYIDPPYNFRQYTSYYFLLNLICEYSRIDNLDYYFSQVQYVRGQNMEKDFVSTFCKKGKFIESLHTLIERANTRFVVLSYFDGRNHWNELDADSDNIGLRKLKELFNTSLFEKGSLEIIPTSRMNYQSYGGHLSREVKEYIFVAEKSV